MGFRSLKDILGTKYPFIQGGMANISNGAFAAIFANSWNTWMPWRRKVWLRPVRILPPVR